MDGELSYKGLEFSMGSEFYQKWSIFGGGFLYTNSEYTKHTNGASTTEKQWRYAEFQLRLHTAIRAG